MTIKEILEEQVNKGQDEHYVLRLFVAGITPRSLKAINNMKKLLAEYNLDCEFEIIDIYQNPIIAKDGQIIAAPTLVKELPLPVRKFIGDMSDTNKLILGLDLKSKKNWEVGISYTEGHWGDTEVHWEKILKMEVNEITGKIVSCAIEVHKSLGPGLLESAYEEWGRLTAKNAKKRTAKSAK
jgi:circadian clock protein KaiB